MRIGSHHERRVESVGPRFDELYRPRLGRDSNHHHLGVCLHESPKRLERCLAHHVEGCEHKKQHRTPAEITELQPASVRQTEPEFQACPLPLQRRRLGIVRRLVRTTSAQRQCNADRADAVSKGTPGGHCSWVDNIARTSNEMDSVGQRLEALLQDCDSAQRRRRDPVDFIHQYEEPGDQEIAGLVASSLAFGNAVTARCSIERVLSALGEHPATTIVEAEHDEILDRLRGFVHRIYRDEHLAVMLSRAAALVRAQGSLARAFIRLYKAAGGDFRESLARFADALRGDARTRNLRHLVSDPRAGSACKRLLLYARWMIRPADGVDLGLWPVAPSKLIIPVDTHIHRISRNLGLTQRRTATWATAEEITTALRRYDPDDPVKYDFALCHLGVSRECPSRPNPAKCERCVLQDVCSVWTRGQETSKAAGSAQEARELRL